MKTSTKLAVGAPAVLWALVGWAFVCKTLLGPGPFASAVFLTPVVAVGAAWVGGATDGK